LRGVQGVPQDWGLSLQALRNDGSLLRVLGTTLDDARAAERVSLALAAVVLTVARPHTAGVLDGATDAWLGWTPERATARHGAAVLAPWTLLNLFRGDVEGAADCAHALCDADQGGMGLILHDWTVARIQGHGPNREAQCFHALRAVMPRSEGHGPGLLVSAAATAVAVAELPRRNVLPWLDEVANEVARRGTARVTPIPARWL
jgi:hypothetical protein